MSLAASAARPGLLHRASGLGVEVFVRPLDPAAIQQPTRAGSQT